MGGKVQMIIGIQQRITRAVLRLVWPFDGIVQKHMYIRDFI